MAVSTSERKRKANGREHNTPPPLPCTPNDLGVLLDKWIVNGVFKPNQVSREPIKEERRDPHFYRLHNYMQHPTAKYWALCRLVHNRFKERTLELSQPEVQRNSLPNHKGKAVATVKICADLREDEEKSLALLVAMFTTLQKSSKFKNLFD